MKTILQLVTASPLWTDGGGVIGLVARALFCALVLAAGAVMVAFCAILVAVDNLLSPLAPKGVPPLHLPHAYRFTTH